MSKHPRPERSSKRGWTSPVITKFDLNTAKHPPEPTITTSKANHSSTPLHPKILSVGRRSIGMIQSLDPAASDGNSACTTAKEALQVLRSTRFDVVICDSQLPDMEAFGFLERVKPKCVEAAFLVFVDKAQFRNGVLAMFYGASGYIVEGQTPSEIFGAIEAARWRKTVGKRQLSM